MIFPLFLARKSPRQPPCLPESTDRGDRGPRGVKKATPKARQNDSPALPSLNPCPKTPKQIDSTRPNDQHTRRRQPHRLPASTPALLFPFLSLLETPLLPYPCCTKSRHERQHGAACMHSSSSQKKKKTCLRPTQNQTQKGCADQRIILNPGRNKHRCRRNNITNNTPTRQILT